METEIGDSGNIKVTDDKGFERNVGPAEIEYQTAQQMLASSEYDQAIFHLRQAVAKKPGYLEAWTTLGKTLSKLKKFEEGMKLAKFCTNKLEETEKKIEIILKDKAGTISTRDFVSNEQEDDVPEAESPNPVEKEGEQDLF